LKIAYSLMTVVALASLSGCGPSASGYCEDKCDCTGCSDNELDECVDNLEDLERSAEDEGCDDQWDDYLTCLDDELECRSGGTVDEDGCERKFLTLLSCLA
jgi:hypothetical protein